MNDLTSALAYFGAYWLGVLTCVAVVYYLLFVREEKKTDDEVAMEQAVALCKDELGASTILTYDTP